MNPDDPDRSVVDLAGLAERVDRLDQTHAQDIATVLDTIDQHTAKIDAALDAIDRLTDKGSKGRWCWATVKGPTRLTRSAREALPVPDVKLR